MDNHRPKWEKRVVRQLLRAGLLFALALSQTALLPSVWLYRTNLVLVVVVCWTLVRGLEGGARWALYGGLALGILSPLPAGAHLLGLALVVLVVAVLTEEFPRDNLLLLTLCIVGGSVLHGLILAGAMQLAGRPINWRLYPFTVILPEALLNALVALPLYGILQRLWQRDRQRGWT